MADLEQELRTLSAQIDVPPAPDVTVEVRRRLAQPAHRPLGPPVPGRWSLGVLVLLAVVAVAFAASPPVRAAAAELFRFAGVDVRWGDPAAPARPAAPLPSQTNTDLVAAQREVDFRIGVPTMLGVPDRVAVADGGRVVSLHYGGSGDGVRLDEFDGTLDPVFSKVVSGEAVPVDVDGAAGLWFPEPHSVTYIGRDGTPFEASARLSGATLIWQSRRVTFRLEGELELAEATAIAESVP